MRKLIWLIPLLAIFTLAYGRFGQGDGGGGGSGDMLKSVYDADVDDVVDSAASITGGSIGAAAVSESCDVVRDQVKGYIEDSLDYYLLISRHNDTITVLRGNISAYIEDSLDFYTLISTLNDTTLKVRADISDSIAAHPGGGESALRSATKYVVAADAVDTTRADYLCDGVNDQTEINQAITASAGGRVVLSEGTFIIHADSSITMAKNVTLQGQGRATYIRMADDNAANIFLIEVATEDTSVSIRNMRLCGRMGAQSGNVSGVRFANTAYGIVSDVYVDSCYYGVLIGSSAKCLLKDNYIQHATNDGIEIRESQDCVMDGNYIMFNVRGLEVYSSTDNFTFSNNVVAHSVWHGIAMTQYSTEWTNHFTIIGNTFHNNNTARSTYPDIELRYVDSAYIANNTFDPDTASGYPCINADYCKNIILDQDLPNLSMAAWGSNRGAFFSRGFDSNYGFRVHYGYQAANDKALYLEDSSGTTVFKVSNAGDVIANYYDGEPDTTEPALTTYVTNHAGGAGAMSGSAIMDSINNLVQIYFGDTLYLYNPATNDTVLFTYVDADGELHVGRPDTTKIDSLQLGGGGVLKKAIQVGSYMAFIENDDDTTVAIPIADTSLIGAGGGAMSGNAILDSLETATDTLEDDWVVKGHVKSTRLIWDAVIITAGNAYLGIPSGQNKQCSFDFQGATADSVIIDSLYILADTDQNDVYIDSIALADGYRRYSKYPNVIWGDGTNQGSGSTSTLYLTLFPGITCCTDWKPYLKFWIATAGTAGNANIYTGKVYGHYK